MIDQIIGSKINQGQMFDEAGLRIPVTNILAGPITVIRLKSKETDGYNAVVVGFGQKRENLLSKAVKGSLSKAGIKGKSPRFLKELRFTEKSSVDESIKSGNEYLVAQVLQVGDIVEVIGTSSGKGFAGVVK